MRRPRVVGPVRSVLLAAAVTVTALASMASVAAAQVMPVQSTVSTTEMREAISVSGNVPDFGADGAGWFTPVAPRGGAGHPAYSRLPGTDWLAQTEIGGLAYNPTWTQYRVDFTQPVTGISGVGIRLLVDNVATGVSVNGNAEFGCTFNTPCIGFSGTPFALVVPDGDLNPRGTANTMLVTVYNADAGLTTGGLDFDIVSGGPALQTAAADTSARATVLMTTSGSFKQAFGTDALVPITLTANNTEGVFVDHGDGTWSWSYAAPKGTLPSAHPITVTASAAGGTDATDAFLYTVLATPDTTAPIVTAPSAPQAAEGTGPAGAVVTFGAATVTDDVDADTTATCIPASGSVFPVGDTIVTCSYTDVSGKLDSDTLTVSVVDTTGPVLTAPNLVFAKATGASGAVVSFPAAATDAVDGGRTVACTPASGSTFPVGDTTVTCTATDATGNTRTVTFTVTVGAWVAPVPTPPLATAVTPVVVACASRRVVTVHAPKRHLGRAVRSVRATIDGDSAAVGRKDGRWTVRVDMRSLARRTVLVELHVRLEGGRRATIDRAFRTCRTAA